MDAPSLATSRHPSRRGVARPRKAATNIASQPCRCGQRRIRSAGPSGPAISTGSSSGGAAQDRVARGVGLGARERADAVDEPARRAEQPGGGGRDPHLEAGEARELVLAARATGARDAGARSRSPSTARPPGSRSNPSRTAGRRPSCDERAARPRRAARWWPGRARAARATRRRPPTVPPAPTRQARWPVLPPGPAQTSRTRSPGCGSSAAHDERRRLVLDREPALGESRQRATGDPEATTSESGCTVPRSVWTRSRVQLAFELVDRRAAGVRADRERRPFGEGGGGRARSPRPRPRPGGARAPPIRPARSATRRRGRVAPSGSWRLERRRPGAGPRSRTPGAAGRPARPSPRPRRGPGRGGSGAGTRLGAAPRARPWGPCRSGVRAAARARGRSGSACRNVP